MSAKLAAGAPLALALALAAGCASSNGSGGSAAQATTAPSTPCKGPPPDPSYVCAQACPPPIARPNQPPPGYVWAPPNRVRDGKVYPCPICLPAGTRIATPRGDVPVEDVHVGLVIWSRDAVGRPVPARVARVGSTPVFGHRLVRLRLADGRVVTASAGHPAADGRALGDLGAGAQLDGSKVVSSTTVPYPGDRTYDLRPDSASGVYFADGVALGSTLH